MVRYLKLLYPIHQYDIDFNLTWSIFTVTFPTVRKSLCGKRSNGPFAKTDSLANFVARKILKVDKLSEGNFEFESSVA